MNYIYDVTLMLMIPLRGANSSISCTTGKDVVNDICDVTLMLMIQLRGANSSISCTTGNTYLTISVT